MDTGRDYSVAVEVRSYCCSGSHDSRTHGRWLSTYGRKVVTQQSVAAWGCDCAIVTARSGLSLLFRSRIVMTLFSVLTMSSAEDNSFLCLPYPLLDWSATKGQADFEGNIFRGQLPAATVLLLSPWRSQGNLHFIVFARWSIIILGFKANISILYRSNRSREPPWYHTACCLSPLSEDLNIHGRHCPIRLNDIQFQNVTAHLARLDGSNSKILFTSQTSVAQLITFWILSFKRMTTLLTRNQKVHDESHSRHRSHIIVVPARPPFPSRCDLHQKTNNSPENTWTPYTIFQNTVVGDEITIIDLWQPRQTTLESGHTHTAWTQTKLSATYAKHEP